MEEDGLETERREEVDGAGRVLVLALVLGPAVRVVEVVVGGLVLLVEGRTGLKGLDLGAGLVRSGGMVIRCDMTIYCVVQCFQQEVELFSSCLVLCSALLCSLCCAATKMMRLSLQSSLGSNPYLR